jgi:hypothetical protein
LVFLVGSFPLAFPPIIYTRSSKIIKITVFQNVMQGVSQKNTNVSVEFSPPSSGLEADDFSEIVVTFYQNTPGPNITCPTPPLFLLENQGEGEVFV